MALRSTVQFTTGPSRCGKSYYRGPRFVLEELLSNPEYRHLSTIPWKMEPWVNEHGVQCRGLIEVAATMGYSAEEIAARVLSFNEDVRVRWRNQSPTSRRDPQGPWVDLKDADLSGVHVAIDEIHNYCGTLTPLGIRAKWSEWLGEIGHSGATIEFISQDESKVAPQIKNEAEVWVELLPTDQQREFITGWKWYYLYSIWAKLGFKWPSSVWQLEKRKVAGRWQIQDQQKFRFEPRYFECYDSFSKPIGGGGQGGKAAKREYEYMSWFQLAMFILRDNFDAIGARLGPTLALGLLWWYQKEVTEYLMGGLKRKQATANAAKDPPSKAAQKAALAAIESEFEKQSFQLMELQQRLKLSESERAELERQLSLAYSVTSIGNEWIQFASGDVVTVGSKLEDGPYKGKVLSHVDFHRRVAELDDGSILRLAKPAPVAAPPGANQWLPVIAGPTSGTSDPQSGVRSTSPVASQAGVANGGGAANLNRQFQSNGGRSDSPTLPPLPRVDSVRR